MPKITALEPQKRRPDRVNLYLDDQFAFGLSRIVAGWLQVGQELSDGKVAALRAEETREQAQQQALLLISYRPRSADEVRQNPRKHEYAETVIETVVARLQEAGLIDDLRFAQTWVENRAAFRPRSQRALQMELRRKGVAEDVIERALEDADDDGAALQAGRQKARRFAALEWQDFRRKLGEFLARRGFGYDVIAPTVRQVWDELHPAHPNTDMENEEPV